MRSVDQIHMRYFYLLKIIFRYQKEDVGCQSEKSRGVCQFEKKKVNDQDGRDTCPFTKQFLS